MHWFAQEQGTLWAIDLAGELPALCEARVPVQVIQIGLNSPDLEYLAEVMQQPHLDMIQQRLQSGRECYTLQTDGCIISYGWVTHGLEHVGELEREFQLYHNEAYIWDCGTAEHWRGQRCYTALLSYLIHNLHTRGTRHIWIGASRQNQASVSGIASAGFRQVVDVSYRRFWRCAGMWLFCINSQEPELVREAKRILQSPHEWRIGRLLVGIYRSPIGD